MDDIFMPEKQKENIEHGILSCFYACCKNWRSFEQELVKSLDYKIISTKHPVHFKYLSLTTYQPSWVI